MRGRSLAGLVSDVRFRKRIPRSRTTGAWTAHELQYVVPYCTMLAHIGLFSIIYFLVQYLNTAILSALENGKRRTTQRSGAKGVQYTP